MDPRLCLAFQSCTDIHMGRPSFSVNRVLVIRWRLATCCLPLALTCLLPLGTTSFPGHTMIPGLPYAVTPQTQSLQTHKALAWHSQLLTLGGLKFRPLQLDTPKLPWPRQLSFSYLHTSHPGAQGPECLRDGFLPLLCLLHRQLFSGLTGSSSSSDHTPAHP